MARIKNTPRKRQTSLSPDPDVPPPKKTKKANSSVENDETIAAPDKTSVTFSKKGATSSHPLHSASPNADIESGYDDDDLKDVEVHSKKPRTLAVAKKRVRGQKVVANAEELTKLQEAFPGYVDPIVKSNDQTLKNTLRMAKAFQHTQLVNATKPSVAALQNERKLTAALGTSAVPGRSIRGDVSVAKTAGAKPAKVWTIKLMDKSKNPVITTKTNNTTFTVHSEQIPEDHDEDADRCMQTLRNILMAWPWPTFGTSEERGLKALVLTCALQQSGVLASFAFNDCSPWAKAYRIIIPWLDSATGEAKERQISFAPTIANTAGLNVPFAYDYLVYREQSRSKSAKHLSEQEQWYREKPPHLKAEASKESLERAQDALRWVAAQLAGLVLSVERLDELLNFYQTQVGMHKSSRGHGKPGIYGGKPMHFLYIDQNFNQLRIAPSAAVLADISPWKKTNRKFDLGIHSMNAVRAAPVLDTMFQLYQIGTDIRKVWIEAAKMADFVNEQIRDKIPPTSECDCSDFEVLHTLHACQRCAVPTICKARAFDRVGRLVCEPCLKIYNARAGGLRQQTDTKVQYIVHRSLRASLRHECRVRGIDADSPELKALLEATEKSLFEAIPDSKTGRDFIDCYTGRLETIMDEIPQMSENPSKRRIMPNTPSVDRPFNLKPPGALLSHTTGNLEITTTALQFAKWRSAPGVLAEAARWMNNPHKTEEEEHAFVTRMTDLQRVLVKAQYHKDYNKAKSEMVSGKVLAGEHGPWELDWSRIVSSATIPSVSSGYVWNEETRSRLGQVAREIFQFFNQEPHVGADGAIFLPPSPGVPEMNWNDIAILCQERLKVMTFNCNKKWTTDDTDESLYCEIIYQYCTHDENYREFLGLPLAAYVWHPLRFSVAHRVHGFKMFTGWAPYPSALSDRDDTANNLLIETWMSNAIKQDIDEAYYNMIIGILKSVSLPKEFYDPNALPTGRIDPSLLNASPEPVQDDYAGEAFDEDALGEDDEKAPRAPAQPDQQQEDRDDSQEEDQKNILHDRLIVRRGDIVHNHSQQFIINSEVTEQLSRLAKHAEGNDKIAYDLVDQDLAKLLGASGEDEAAERDVGMLSESQFEGMDTAYPDQAQALTVEYWGRVQDVSVNHAHMLADDTVTGFLALMLDAARAGDLAGYHETNVNLSRLLYD